jgi:hypothetical protein
MEELTDDTGMFVNWSDSKFVQPPLWKTGKKQLWNISVGRSPKSAISMVKWTRDTESIDRNWATMSSLALRSRQNSRTRRRGNAPQSMLRWRKDMMFVPKERRYPRCSAVSVPTRCSSWRYGDVPRILHRESLGKRPWKGDWYVLCKPYGGDRKSLPPCVPFAGWGRVDPRAEERRFLGLLWGQECALRWVFQRPPKHPSRIR